MDENPEIGEQIKKNSKKHYLTSIKKRVNAHKQTSINQLNKRKDFQSIFINQKK